MKIVAGIVAASALAGTVAVVGSGLHGAPGADGTAPLPTAAPGAGANPVTKQIAREDVFEFAQKPSVKKEGDKWIITFASKGRCDATVAILDGKGKIVRHLASGVLGPNAPRPYKQGALAQSVEWDGKDDAGKPAPRPCKVRVSLGLKPKFDKMFGWAPLMDIVTGLVVDPRNGQLYVMQKPHPYGCWNSIRVFDRGGRYLRTIMPRPASVPPERMTLIEWTKTAWGDPAIYRPRSGGGTVFDMYRWPGFVHGFPWQQGPVVTPNGRLALISGFLFKDKKPGRRLIFLDTRDGAAPPGSVVDADKGTKKNPGVLGDGRMFMAVSPDGKWLYLGGAEVTQRYRKGGPSHAVSRVSLEKPGPAERFVGEYGKAGADNAHLNGPRGVACDGAGNLYVADWGNDRIQVFKPDGKHLGTIPVEKPDQLAVHPKTGAVYVLCAAPKGQNAKLLTLGGLKDPAERAALELPPRQKTREPIPVIALDAASDPPAVWVAADRLWRVEDRGDKFEKILDVQEKNKLQYAWRAGRDRIPHIAADPFREELYIREAGGNCNGSPVVRVDGRTGKLIERLDEPIESICVGGPDGAVYMRLAQFPLQRWLVRYDPDGHKYLPFPKNGSAAAGGERPKLLGKDVALGPYVPQGPARRAFSDQWGVAPNGDVYVLAGPTPEQIAELEKAGLPRPEKIRGTRLLQVFSPDGRLKARSALPGLYGGDGGIRVRVGRDGAVYVAGPYQPAGQEVPDGIAPDGKYHCALWGTILKFDSSFDKFPVGSIAGTWEKLVGKPTHYAGVRYKGRGVPIRVENMAWDYGGVVPLVQGGCTCLTSLFDLDRFERVFAPAGQTCSVNVLDANGNLILRVGRYGNVDSRGKDSPVPDPKTGLLRPRRPDDPADLKGPFVEPDLAFIWPEYVTVTDEAMYVEDNENQRLVRAVLEYETEESVPLP